MKFLADQMHDPMLEMLCCLHFAKLYMRQDKTNDACEWGERALKTGPGAYWATKIKLGIIAECQIFRGELSAAEELIEQIGTASRPSDDMLAADLLILKGRIKKQMAEYGDAVALYDQAIEKYQKSDPSHPRLAWCHVYKAFVLLRLAQSARAEGEGDQSLCEGVRSHLTEAENICSTSPGRFSRLQATILNLRARLSDYTPDPIEPKAAAVAALRLGEAMRDCTIMADAELLLSELHAKDSPDVSGRELVFAVRAVRHARETHNRRLQANALMHLGQVLLKPPFADFLVLRGGCKPPSGRRQGRSAAPP